MLRFATKPDHVFLVLLTDAIDLMVDELQLEKSSIAPAIPSPLESATGPAHTFHHPRIIHDVLMPLRL